MSPEVALTDDPGMSALGSVLTQSDIGRIERRHARGIATKKQGQT
jgi:hypothetical protein